MTVEHKYTCNLCLEEIDATDTEIKNAGIGIIWKMSAPTMRATSVYDADHHLCRKCVKDIKELNLSDWLEE